MYPVYPVAAVCFLMAAARGVWVGAGQGAGSCSPLWGDRGPGEMGTPCWKSQLWGTSLIVTWLQGPEKRSQLSGFSLFRTNRKSHDRAKRAPCEPRPAGRVRAAAGVKVSGALSRPPQKVVFLPTPPVPTSLTTFRATWKLAKANQVRACSTWHVVLQYSEQSGCSNGPCCHVGLWDTLLFVLSATSPCPALLPAARSQPFVPRTYPIAPTPPRTRT